MSDYTLYYWPVPFRGQFIRAILAFADKTWDEFDAADIGTLTESDPREQPVPFMGPPVLVEHSTGFALAEMPAIAWYLGETLGLMPDGMQARALVLKVVNDANDVIDELTLNGGQKLWSKTSWHEFVPRLERWMTIFESLAERHDVKPESGYLLGSQTATIADIVTATLWSTVGARFPVIARLLDAKAPIVAALSKRVMQTPALINLVRTTDQRFGDAYCGGQIEQSMRSVIKDE